MADDRHKPGGKDLDPEGQPDSPPVAIPLAAAEDIEWEFELAAWDAAIPIVTRASAVPGLSGPHAAPGAPGAVPEEENPFFETPTTVVSQTDLRDLDDLPEMIPAGAFDEGVAPASGSYAALVATDSSAPSIFERDPVPDQPPSFPTDTLREMSATPWSEDIRQLIVLGDVGVPAAPERAYLETLARLIAEERSFVRDGERTVALGLAAARVADMLGNQKEATEHVEAALGADGSSPVAHRARLLLAERQGRVDDERAADSLARLALRSHPDQAYYRSLRAEWMLARAARGMVDATAAAMITAAPEGLPRMLAEAELAWRQPPVAAAILETAGHRIGGGLGAALLVAAAGLNEIAHDFQSAAEQRFVAARLDDQGAPAAVGLIRDLARMEAATVVPALEDLLTRFSPSPLKVALARWGASAARRIGDPERAWRFVADPARIVPAVAPMPTAAGADSISAALARDRLDLVPVVTAASDSGARSATSEIDSMLGRVGLTWSTPIARICLALRACELAVDAEGIGFALGAVEKTVAEVPDATVLAPAVEAISWRATLPATRLRGLRLWRRIDPARWLSASLDLVDTLQAGADLAPSDSAALDSDGTESTASVLNEIAAADASSPVFWRLAALAAGRGAFAEAAGHIDGGLGRASWREGTLFAPLGELAAEMTARTNPLAAATRMQALRAEGTDAQPPGARQTLGRGLRRLGDRDLWASYVHAEIGSKGSVDRKRPPDGETDRQRHAALLLESIFWPPTDGGGDEVGALVSKALDVAPLHPVALGLALGERPGPDGGTLVERLVAGASGPGGSRWTLGAAIAAAVAGDARRALSLATDADRAAEKDDRAGAGGDLTGTTTSMGSAVAAVVRRFAWAAPDPEQRDRIVRGLAIAGIGAGAVLETAETVPSSNATDAGAQSGTARVADRLGPLEDATRAGRWDDVVARLVDNPPHEDQAGASILTLAAEIAEGRTGGARAREMWTRAGADPGVWLRIGDRKDADPIEVGAALEQLAGAAAFAPDERSAALLLLEAARLGIGMGEGDKIDVDVPIEIDSPDAAPTPSAVERRLSAAVRYDPKSAPAAMAWRRWLIRSGRITEAAQASAGEAEALIDPTLRVQALLRAAAMLAPSAVVEIGPGGATLAEADGDWVGRAAGFLRRALEIAPNDHEVFTRLRELYEETGRQSDLADLLATRLGATSNPFEVTALHLARAEIFAGPLRDRRRAKIELDAILQKEPQHARALGRLADLEQEDGNDTGAAELLIRRAFIERSPEKLRELFLRLGRIYTQRLPDPKRALGAYSRVLQLDANNREALDELSKLYLGLGETKNAIAITERLVRIETAPERRAVYHIRLGHLAERAVDPRAASQSFRRAVEEAPRDIEALGELARYLEKTRDTAARRALLDHAASDLRAAVLTNLGDKSLLDALVAVLRWRGRTVSAAAAAELGALVASFRADPGKEARLPEWAAPPPGGRRLAAVTKPSVDEQTFPVTVPPSVRQLFRLLGPTLWEGGRSDLSRLGVDRADRAASGRSPRDIFDAVAGELAAGPFELYVVPARSESGPAPLHVEPGKPPVIVLGASLLKLGPHGLRFAAGRTLRLVSTHLDMALAGGAGELGAWLGGIIRQFIGDYRHADIPAEITAARAARVAKLLPRKLRQEVMPFAMESSAQLDLAALHAGIRDGANRIGLCASGSLGAALRVILTASGAGTTWSADSIKRNPEALTLLAFALSDEHDDLVRSLE